MPIGITDDHEELRSAVRRFLDDNCSPSVLRSALDAPVEQLPEFWPSLGKLGWLALHLPEACGGAGYSMAELVVVVEELGRSCAPGPAIPHALAVAALAASERAGATALARRLAAGEAVGTLTTRSGLLGAQDGATLRVSGTVEPVVAGCVADVLLAPVEVDGAPRWCAIEIDQVDGQELRSLDPTRRVARLTLDDQTSECILDDLTTEAVADLTAIVLAAEAAGLAQWCVDEAAAYAAQREQFGRPIGQFQAVKHRCAEMLARTEIARSAAWDAARAWGDDENGSAVAIATAAALAFGVRDTAKDCVQTFGGIGFTWEHDAHVYLRRASSIPVLLGSQREWRRRAARAALNGTRRRLDVELPPEADEYRAEVRAVLAELDELGDDRKAQRRLLADRGYLAPSWPVPWGRDASALEQLVIEEEFRKAKRRRANLGIAAWALPTVIVYGTAEQQERWVRPSLRGEIAWCQLFSEPGAGSDLAALRTKAVRDGEGWVVNGQKVWTSMADEADWGILLARTDPDAPKHEGITCFMLDMASEGIEIRPLRELTGLAMFNEVFFDDVFIPDDCVVGAVNDGWRAARTTLANERVYMGGGATIAGGVVGIMKMLQDAGLDEDPDRLDELGELICVGHALGVLGFRLTLQALSGANPSGSEASVRKLLGTRHDQRIGEMGVSLFGEAALADEGDSASWIYQYLFNQALTIAGGTSDIQRNVIAERLLGLPRDP